ncbi:PREDICTED: protein enabled homolog isoform X2 [Amphimedon queenslandica]|uniref:Uncharacterized protein n=1 Tax=Amphimedon queenslandica TaxID=400682 RepID=A0A1X7V4X8_AMPQE|nr:PREDICTED: protein enabled homolog isoform X2 [Amphimedon queenslandica]|eukprot:XP_019850637.1 PREDICTED: protein enabled homolog isoform X2 [Amphimedon queenslandica]
MSYTVPPRRQAPAVYRRQHNATERSGPSTDDPPSSASPDSARPQQQQQQPIHSRGFHIISPNPEKNAKLQQRAREEEEAYSSYKEKKRASQASRFAVSSRLGGERLSPYSIDEMRERQERTAKMEAKREPIRRQIEREERRAEQMRKESEKIEEHKMRQREKSERLERQRALTEPARQEEIRRKRLEYLEKK